jgi:hypothetical protein
MRQAEDEQDREERQAVVFREGAGRREGAARTNRRPSPVSTPRTHSAIAHVQQASMGASHHEGGGAHQEDGRQDADQRGDHRSAAEPTRHPVRPKNSRHGSEGKDEVQPDLLPADDGCDERHRIRDQWRAQHGRDHGHRRANQLTVKP